MLDFIALFAEGLLLFVLAMISNNENIFYTALAGLLIFDTIWVGTTNLTASTESDKVPRYFMWALINVIASCLLCLFVWSHLFDMPVWKNLIARSIALMVVVIIRTVIDYIWVWQFYYPKGESVQVNPIPAPPPATPPKSEPKEHTNTPASTATADIRKLASS